MGLKDARDWLNAVCAIECQKKFCTLRSQLNMELLLKKVVAKRVIFFSGNSQLAEVSLLMGCIPDTIHLKSQMVEIQNPLHFKHGRWFGVTVLYL